MERTEKRRPYRGCVGSLTSISPRSAWLLGGALTCFLDDLGHPGARYVPEVGQSGIVGDHAGSDQLRAAPRPVGVQPAAPGPAARRAVVRPRRAAGAPGWPVAADGAGTGTCGFPV